MSAASAVGQDGVSGDSAPTNDAEAQVRSAIQSYVAAFNARDVEKLVAHWSPQGVYTSRTTGEQLVGNEAMTEEFAAILTAEGAPTLAVVTESIEFVSPNVALERGSATVSYADDEVAVTNYSVVYVNHDGEWLIDRVTEDEVVAEPSHYQQLQALEWIIGDWVDQGADFQVEIACDWTKNQNFISRRFTVRRDDEVVSTGLQVIGYDAKLEQIRSWLFDSNGGTVAGVWTQRDDQWIVQSVATLADGSSGSFTSIFRPMEDGAYAWQKINRVLAGKLLPNIDEVILQRQ